MLDRGIEKVIERKGFTYLFSDVSSAFRQTDAVVINLECPLTNENNPTRKPFVFQAKPCYADSLRKMGVTHACMANNHTYDQGTNGVADTKHYLSKAGIEPIGVGKTSTERLRPKLIVNGRDTLALFSISFLMPCNWDNKEGAMGINIATASQLASTIRLFKQKHQQAKIVVMPHWGIEYDTLASAMQHQQAETLVNAGADLVVGHHPHVMQNSESIRGSNVFYSLGNFVFDQNRKVTQKAAMLEVTLNRGLLKSQLIPINISHFHPTLSME